MVQTQADQSADRVLVRRREILLEASKAFREKGFHATGMRDISSRLGMTVGNLYYYFESKEDLLAFCQEETLRRLEQLVGWVHGLDVRADTRLHLLVGGHMICLNEGAQGSLAHLEIPAPETDSRGLLARRDRYEAALRRVLREGIEAGVFRATDEKVSVMAILGAVNWTVRWYRPEGNRSLRSLAAEFADHLVRGLMAPGVELAPPTLAWPTWEEGDAMSGKSDG